MLIDCVECGREVSDTAETCPGCGAGVRMSLPWYVRMNRPAPGPREGIFLRTMNAITSLVIWAVLLGVAYVWFSVT